METQKLSLEEFEKLNQKVWSELQKVFDLNVAVGYNKDEIEIHDEDLKIKLTNHEGRYDYWTWEIETSHIKIFISSTNQSMFVFSKAKTYRVDCEININYSYVEQDLYICIDSEFAFEEIVEIIKAYRQKGEQGLFEKFLDDYQIATLI